MLFLLLSLVAPPTRADVDPADYQTPRALRSEAERQRWQADFAREKEAQAQREREQALAEENRRAEEAARLAARPWPERLTEARCTSCHAATNYTANGHTLAGWWLVILRMRFLNGAPLGWQEMAAIADHLAATRPADHRGALIESAMIASIPSLLIAAVILFRRRKPPHSRKEP